MAEEKSVTVNYLEHRLKEMADETEREKAALAELTRKADEASVRIAALDKQIEHYQVVLEMEKPGSSVHSGTTIPSDDSITDDSRGKAVERRMPTTDVREALEDMLSDGEPRSMNYIMDWLGRNLGRTVSRSTVRTVLMRIPNVEPIGRGVFRMTNSSLTINGEQPSAVS